MHPASAPFIMVNPSGVLNEMPLCINIRKEVRYGSCILAVLSHEINFCLQLMNVR